MSDAEEVTQRAGSLRSMTGLTEAEFQALLPYLGQTFVAYMQDRTIDGQPRTSRRYTTYGTCPLPTTADKIGPLAVLGIEILLMPGGAP